MAGMSPALAGRLMAISQALAGHTEPGAALAASAAEIGRLIPHDHLDIAVLWREGQEHICYETGMQTSWSGLAERPMPVEVSPVRSVICGEMPYLLTADALVDERFHFAGAIDEPIFTARLRSRIIVPLRARGRVMGTLNISRQDPACYGAPDVDVAQHCADFLAPYIYALTRAEEARQALLAESEARLSEELLRTGALHLTEGMERERRRLAMDLHDQTLGDLARVMRQLAALRSQGAAGAEELAAIELEIATCLSELRHIIDDMRPGVLELFGLGDALESHLNRSVRSARPPIAVHFTDDSAGAADNLPEPARTALYRIAQEAINNAVRHARPSRIDLRLAACPQTLRVSVTDDGCGCGEAAQAASGGIGHMRTRAALIGAALSIAPAAAAGGTSVTVALPREGAAGKAPASAENG
jgi:signal transduction histidine kinase